MYIYVNKIQELVRPLLENLGIELVELKLHRTKKRIVLKFFVDKPEGGINLDECAQLNESIGKILDKEDLIQESFILEVSSPGLDRPLMTIKDFTRVKGRNIRIFLREAINGKTELIGKVSSIRGNNIIIDIVNQEIEIPLNKINKAKQIF
jgi:ribosome maturation factor RimP